jgi:hypothetical protein
VRSGGRRTQPTTANERSNTGPAGHRHTTRPKPAHPTGPRHASSGWGEAPLGLRWQDVDLVEGTITISMQLQRVAGKLRHDETKTDDSTRMVALPQPCVRALGRHRAQQATDRLGAGDLWTDSDLVFTTRKACQSNHATSTGRLMLSSSEQTSSASVFMIFATRAPRSCK